MADGLQFSLIGLDELLGKLDSVRHETRYKGGRFALRKAAQVVRDQARANAERLDDPATDANIAANIVERWSGRRFRRTGDLMFRVGVMGGAGGNKPSEEYAGLPGRDTRHWRFLEFGTEKTRAQPFMRPAMEQSINAATNTFLVEYGRAIDRAIRRAQRRGEKA